MSKNAFFNEINNSFGFGCMRLPMKGDEVDLEEMKKMTDHFIAEGFNYFDTAHGYLGGASEKALKVCLTARYPRESYILADKLSTHFFNSEEEIIPLFEKQLEACGVEYFDFYLMHAQDADRYRKYKRCRAYETILKLREEGRIKHFGISFHDRACVLEQILSEYPQIEFVQIQFNYVDYEDATVESRKVYEVCGKYGKPVFVMEPVKGGSLVNLPEKAQKILDDLHGPYSNAGYALRFAASFPNVCMVLSGMSSLEQMEENTACMKELLPLSDGERKAIDAVREVYHSMDTIPCTGCHYCVLDNDCPKNILIPEVFACYNKKQIFNNGSPAYYYNRSLTQENGKASECLGCGGCERICPQHLPIRKLLKLAAQELEQK